MNSKNLIVSLSVIVAIVTVGWSGLPLFSLYSLATGIGATTGFYYVANESKLIKMNILYRKKSVGIFCFILLLFGASVGTLIGTWAIEISDINLSPLKPLGSFLIFMLCLGFPSGITSGIFFIFPIWVSNKITKRENDV